MPSTLLPGDQDYGKTFKVSALAVNAALTTPSEEDFYVFNGQAGQVMTFQVISNTNTLNPQSIIPELVLIGPNGLVPMYSFATTTGPRPGGGDTLVGGAGNDTIIGSTGNDLIIFPPASSGNATILAGSGQDVVNVTGAPAENLTTTGSVAIEQNVNQAVPIITWAAPAGIGYGTPLDNSQLDATATVMVNGNPTTVSGTFVYSPPAGTVLGARANQPLSVTFTPADSTAFTSVTAHTTIGVLQAPTTIVWPKPADIAYGTALATSQLDATANAVIDGNTVSVPGTFTYSAPAGTVLHAGGNQLITVTFTPTDSADYISATSSSTISVLTATPTITWPAPANITYGTALGNVQLDAAAGAVVNGQTITVAGVFSYGTPAGTLLHAGSNQPLTGSMGDMSQAHAGSYPITAMLSDGSGHVSDYLVHLTSGALTVTPAMLNVTADAKNKIYGQSDPALTFHVSGLQLSDSAVNVLAGSLSRAAGEHVLGSPYAIGQGSLAANNDYILKFTGSTLIVTPAPLTITANNQTKPYGAAVPILTASYSGFVNGDTSASLTTPPTLTTTGTAGSHVGSYQITALGAVDADYAINYAAG